MLFVAVAEPQLNGDVSVGLTDRARAAHAHCRAQLHWPREDDNLDTSARFSKTKLTGFSIQNFGMGRVNLYLPTTPSHENINVGI